jgi:hypothetical protein
MSELFRRRAAWSIVAALAGWCLPVAAQGATINMILSDVDVVYNGQASGNAGSIYDLIGQPGGNLNAAEADEVETAVFEVDTTHAGTLMNSAGNTLSADLRVNGVGPTLALNTLVTNVGSNGGGFGFDWFTQSGNNLRLGINALDNILLTNNVLFFSGTASVVSQSLPFGLAFVPNSTVVFSYTATLPSLNGVSPTQMAAGSGALTISGTLVPEPGTIGLLGLGAVMLGYFSSASARRPRNRC